jgi:hypothetical protein
VGFPASPAPINVSGASRSKQHAPAQLRQSLATNQDNTLNHTTLHQHHANMSLTASIPRFLLPQRGTIWRAHFTPFTPLTTVRYASKSRANTADKPIVLEKPTKFNPPSHGSRRPKPAPRYPGPNLSTEEKELQQKKQYPHMMPPEGSFFHWFLHNKSIHIWITLVRPRSDQKRRENMR